MCLTPGPGMLPGCLYERTAHTLPSGALCYAHIGQVGSIATVACMRKAQLSFLYTPAAAYDII